jgi:hypothetical protein
MSSTCNASIVRGFLDKKDPRKKNSSELAQQCEIVKKCCVVMHSCDFDPCMGAGTVVNATGASSMRMARIIELILTFCFGAIVFVSLSGSLGVPLKPYLMMVATTY